MRRVHQLCRSHRFVIVGRSQDLTAPDISCGYILNPKCLLLALIALKYRKSALRKETENKHLLVCFSELCRLQTAVKAKYRKSEGSSGKINLVDKLQSLCKLFLKIHSVLDLS